MASTPPNTQTPTPAGTPSKPAPPVSSPVSAQGTVSSSDALVHLLLGKLLPTQGQSQGLSTSNLATGLVSGETYQPFQFASDKGHQVKKSMAPQGIDLLERPKVKAFCDRFGRVTVTELTAEIIPCAEAIGHVFSVTCGWLPKGMTAPAGTVNLKAISGSQTFTVGGMAFASHRFTVPCPFDKGIQPVLKAPLPFANTPVFYVGVHKHVLAKDGSESEEAADLFDVIISGKLVYEGVFVEEW